MSTSWALLAQQGGTGAAGAQGSAGAAGSVGASGPQGPAGATGAAGLHWQGTYNSGTGYITGDAVAYVGASYVSLSDGNSGNTPGTSTSWALLAAAGATGSAGAAGTNGNNGSNGTAATVQIGTVSTGAAGTQASVQNVGSSTAAVLNLTLPQGATGAAGTAGLTYQGTWSGSTGYSIGDVVYRNGSSYVSQTSTNTADPVVSVANNSGEWKLLVSQGAPGAATVSIGTVSSGTNAAVTNSGTQNAAVLNFTLPKGDAGVAGPAGLTFLGAWAGGTAYQPTNAVSYNGSAYIARVANTAVHPVGDAGSAAAWLLLAAQGSTGTTGSTGATGATGATPAISVHSTTTTAAGTSASVTNSGTATNVQLDFSIPQGAAGTSGTSSGGPYTTVHTVAPMNAGLQVYSPLVDGHAAGDAYAILGWLPSTCNLASVQVYNSSGTAASFEIHTGTPGSMAVTTAGTCSVHANSTATCTGPGILGSSNFLSFGITSASGLTTYVYTQFSCN